MSWTAILATWGAITGTIGILLQLRNFWRDRPYIVVSAMLNNLINDSRRRFEVRIVNCGRRPVFTDSVIFEFRKIVWQPTRTVRRWREEHRDSAAQRELKENEPASFYPSEVLLEFGDDFAAVHRVGVKDTTGRTWWSRRSIGERALFGANAGYSFRSVDSPDGELLSLDKDRHGYRLFNPSDRLKPSRRFSWRWIGMRAFEQAQRKLHRCQSSNEPQAVTDTKEPNTVAAPDR
jgi:hypothetical protein